MLLTTIDFKGCFRMNNCSRSLGLLYLSLDAYSTWAAKMVDRSHRHRIDDGVVDEIVTENVEMIDCRTFFSVPEQRRTDQSRKKCLENKSNQCYAPNSFFRPWWILPE